MPSIKKAFQCSRTAALISDFNLFTSWGRVIENLRCRHRRMTSHYSALTPPGQVCSLARAGERGCCRGRKAIRRRAHAIATENRDRRGGQQQGAADQDGDEADWSENQRHVGVWSYQPAMNRRQDKGQTCKSGAA